MTLMEQITQRVQDVTDVAAHEATQAEFRQRYVELLTELQAGLFLMRQLGIMQAAWLQGQADKQARWN